MMNPLPVVRAELRRASASAIAAVTLIAIAVALGVGVTAQERALRVGSARAADPFDLVVGARGSATQLVLSTVYLQPGALELVSGEVVDRVMAERGVTWAAPIAFGDSHRGAPVVGTTAAYVTRGETRRVERGRVFAARNEAVVGADVALALGAQFSPAHGETARAAAPDDAVHSGVDYRVVGMLPRTGTPWDRAILVPIEAVWRLHARPTGHARGIETIGPPWEAGASGASAVIVKAMSVADAYRLRGRYRGVDSLAVFPAEVLVELYGTLGDARDLLAIVALLTQGLVVAAVMLAVLAGHAERRRLFGVLRALGASRAYVFAAVWLHATCIIAAGGLVGLALGWQTAALVSHVVRARTGLALLATVSGPEIRLVLGLILAGAAAAILPAWRAHRQPVASLLSG
jgi:putative ABC transport system permease protein